MVRSTSTNYTTPSFPKASADGDAFDATDVQQLAAAVDGHVHDGAGKGAVLADGSIGLNSPIIQDGAINAAKIQDNTITSSKIADGAIQRVDMANLIVDSTALASSAVTTAKLADAAVTNAKLASDTARANLLTNGGFEIWQRGNGPFTATFGYCADRWQVLASAGTASVTPHGASIDVGSRLSAQVVTTAPAAGGNGVYQVLDSTDMSAIRAQQVTVSARVLCSQASSVRIGLAQGKAGAASVFSSYHTGGGGWETLSASILQDGGNGLTIYILGAVAGTWYVDNVVLVKGSVAADYAPLHPADDLARCSRYYELIGTPAGSDISGRGNVAVGSSLETVVRFRAVKAVAPTVTKVGTWTVASMNQPAPTGATVEGCRLSATATGALADGYFLNLAAGSNATAEANP